MSLTVEPEIKEEIGEVIQGLLEYHEENFLPLPSKLNIKISNPHGYSYRAILFQTADPLQYQLQKLKYLKR